MVSDIKGTSDTFLAKKGTSIVPTDSEGKHFFFPFFFQLSSVAKYCTWAVALFLLSVAVLELHLEIKNKIGCFLIFSSAFEHSIKTLS